MDGGDPWMLQADNAPPYPSSNRVHHQSVSLLIHSQDLISHRQREWRRVKFLLHQHILHWPITRTPINALTSTHSFKSSEENLVSVFFLPQIQIFCPTAPSFKLLSQEKRKHCKEEEGGKMSLIKSGEVCTCSLWEILWTPKY